MTSPIPRRTFPTTRLDDPGARPARPLRAAVAPARRPPAGPCSACGGGHNRVLDMIGVQATWLVPRPDGTPTERRFCRACAPRQPTPIADLTCQRCYDGPLITGDLAGDTKHPSVDVNRPATLIAVLPPVTRDWLTGRGWDLDGATAPLCPHCAPTPRA